MNTAHSAYRQSTKTSLTRIDMLIALYGKTLKTLESGIEALNEGDESRYALEHITAFRCLLALLDGIDASTGEVAENTQRLCLFATSLIREPVVECWENAVRILRPLHDSFVQIRDEAVALELKGDIPTLRFENAYEYAVL